MSLNSFTTLLIWEIRQKQWTRVACICISGKYLAFYYAGGRSAEAANKVEACPGRGALQSTGAQEAQGATERKRRREEESEAGGCCGVRFGATSVYAVLKGLCEGKDLGRVGNLTTSMIKATESDSKCTGAERRNTRGLLQMSLTAGK